MATKLKTFDFTKASKLTEAPEEKVLYPWDEWFDGDIWQLQEGEDFETHPLMMERIIRTRATGKRAKVRVKHLPLNGDPWGTIVMQRHDVQGPLEARKTEAKAKRAAKKAEAEADAQAMLAKAGIKSRAISKTPSKRPVKKAAARA